MMRALPTTVRRQISYAVTFAVLFAGDFLLRGSTWRGSVELHTLMEVVATLLAVNVGVLALIRYYSQKDNTFLFIGSGFLGTGFLDGYHAVVTSSNFVALFPSSPPSLIPWSWLASRLFLSISLYLSWVFWKREQTLGPAGRIDERRVYGIFSVLTLVCFVFFAVAPLPPGYSPHLIIQRPQELIPAAFFGLALVCYLRKGNWRSDPFEHWLVLSLIVGFVTQLMFMSLSTQLYDMMFDMAHLLKKGSYICVLTGLLISMYRLFWLSASEPVIVCDRTTGAFVDVNQQMADLFGYTREEMLKLGGNVFSGPGEPYTQADLKQALELTPPSGRQRFERRCNAKDGHLIWTECELERGAFGGRDAVLLRVRDITERERAEAALRRSEEKFRSVAEVAQDAIVMIDADGAIIYWNPAAERIFGYSSAEASGRNVHRWLTPERYRAAAVLGLAEFAKSGHGPVIGKTLELEALRKDGVEIPVELSIAAAPIGSGWGAISIIRDITERRRAADAVRKSEEKYRNLAESTSDFVWETDQNGRYTYVSPVVKSLLGYEPSELLGKSPFEIMAPAEAQRFAAAFAQISTARQSFSLLENTILHKSGQEVVLETGGVPILDMDGTFRGYRGIDRNVTEHKVAEKALQQRDALMHAASAIARELVTTADLDDAIRQALHLIGQVGHVDRITVVESPLALERGRIRYLWEGPRYAEKMDAGFFRAAAAEDPPEVRAWYAPLKRGQIVTLDMRTAPSELRATFERFGFKKLLIVPIMVDSKYWGRLALDSCDQDRIWVDYEVELFQTIAQLFGTAIQRDRYLKELADANRIVQNTPTILYRMRGEPSLPMIYISQNIRLFGHDPAVLTASPLLYRDLIHPDDLELAHEFMAHALAGETGVVEFRMLTSRGGFRWVENRYMPLLDSAGRLVEVEGLLSDITERKAAEDKIARLARTDSLTGLANRTTFIERLRQLFAAARRGAPMFAVLYLDLDRFKDINDTLGHPVGDRLLVDVGERLQRCMRETDLTARIGGDEFAVLLSDLTSTSDAGTLAEKLRAAIAEPIQIAGNELHMTASVGIAIYEPNTTTPDDMLAQADVALYRAKEEGRDQYRFHTEELDVQVRDQVTIAEELRHGIRRGEFELYYQPQIELSTNEIVGMEALIRWNHPKRGLLLPASFIEIAERTGSMTAIGQWVLDTACRQMSLWRAAGVAPPTIAVNLSPVQIKAANEFVEFVRATLEKWHLAPAEVELDVTESTLARATLSQNDVLERLQKMGVKISIDDFGMKYSSLDYLRTYHVNRIKIPQPLINSATSDRESAAMARAIVGIARELDIEVIAEGVETEAQWSFLTATSRVPKVQGYYFSKPVPVDNATTLLRRKRIEPGSPAADRQVSAVVA